MPQMPPPLGYAPDSGIDWKQLQAPSNIGLHIVCKKEKFYIYNTIKICLVKKKFQFLFEVL